MSCDIKWSESCFFLNNNKIEIYKRSTSTSKLYWNSRWVNVLLLGAPAGPDGGSTFLIFTAALDTLKFTDRKNWRTPPGGAGEPSSSRVWMCNHLCEIPVHHSGSGLKPLSWFWISRDRSIYCEDTNVDKSIWIFLGCGLWSDRETKDRVFFSHHPVWREDRLC